MYKISLALLLAVSISFSQWGLRAGVALSSKINDVEVLPTFITIGSQYTIIDEKEYDVNLIVDYGFGSITYPGATSSATWGMAEFGANFKYGFGDNLSAVGTLTFTSYSLSAGGLTLTSQDSKTTIIAGLAYKLGDSLSLEGGYALEGNKGIRAGLAFMF